MFRLIILITLLFYGCKTKKFNKCCDVNFVYYYEIKHGDHFDTLDFDSYIINYDTSWVRIKEIPTIKQK